MTWIYNLIRIGTRGSKLALWQANYVQNYLSKNLANTDSSVSVIKTSGDNIQNRRLSAIGGKGLFVKEIEESLMDGEIDIAVHSMKDVPSELPKQLHIGAVMKREDPRDIIVSRDNVGFFDLSPGSRIGTGSLRRQVQILLLRDDVELKDIRGNVDTRLAKLKRNEYDAIILAYAGIKRLGLENHITEVFDINDVIPSAGQGIIGIECRKDDADINEILKLINHGETRVSITAERNFVRMLGGDCNLPIACHCEFVGNEKIKITGLVASTDGNKVIKHSLVGDIFDSLTISRELANIILNRGGKDIVDSYRLSSDLNV